ncbi:expressed unknown protein [Seminavis robusta]|uniref:Uncharacterized protein n=1 Tax=Seminavis robusta TaxID=568900 RepID=A0A9N8F005_9STRA|nr:expressed unknown protein [Seminavis robusta]|eukprot:Sro2341_g324080.1 n/a (118) ;mRNA; r:8510-8863
MCRPATTTTSSPATAALESLISSSNKRVKRSTMDSPNASFTFDMSELFNLATEDESPLAFPSIEFGLDDASDDDDKSVSSICTNLSTLSDSSSLGKRSRTGGMTRSKKARSLNDLMG